jgi:uncharacterized phage protein (TIGR02218 family)
MTVFEDTELSTHDGSPVEAYKFTGTFTNYYYTSAETVITLAGQPYIPVPIKRSAIRMGDQSADGADIVLTVPYDLQLVVDYAYETTPPDLELEILRFHEGLNPASEFAVIWKGIVSGFSVSGHLAEIRVPSIFSVAMRGEVPSVYYQAPCNNVLYDGRCGLTKSSYQQDTTIVSVNENTVEVADDGFADDYLQAGEIYNLTRGERRLITSNVANVLTINFPFYNAQAGDSVSLFAGCDHSWSTCKSKFSNGDNFNGFPFMPGDNPFESEL